MKSIKALSMWSSWSSPSASPTRASAPPTRNHPRFAALAKLLLLLASVAVIRSAVAALRGGGWCCGGCGGCNSRGDACGCLCSGTTATTGGCAKPKRRLGGGYCHPPFLALCTSKGVGCASVLQQRKREHAIAKNTHTYYTYYTYLAKLFLLLTHIGACGWMHIVARR